MASDDTNIRKLLDDSPIGVAVVDNETHERLFVNLALVRMFGAETPSELLEAPVIDSWVRPSQLRELQKALDAELPVINFEAERRRLNGETWWTLINSRPISFEGRPARMVWHTDITDRKRAEAASRASEKKSRVAQDRLLSAIEALEDGFVLYDKDDRFVLANQRYREIYPKSAPYMVHGTPFETILRRGLEQGEYDIGGKSNEAWLTQRLEEHRSGNRNIEQKLEDGTWLQIAERRTDSGEIVGFRVDVTGLKRIQEELNQAKEVAETAVEVKSAFLATMSHEIRTPLGGILGLSDILLSTNLSAEQQELVEKLKAAGSGLLVILNDILDLSKLEAGKLAIEAIDFDLTGLIEESVDLFRPRAEANGISLAVDTDTGVPTSLHGDPTRIRQVLINLIGNAVKFTHQGRVTLKTLQVSNGDRHRLRFEVSDTGIGISPDVVDDLFDDFVQADASTSRRYAGTGLGLAISRRLVELMGGSIDVESTEGVGSTFSFEIPAIDANDPDHIPDRRMGVVEWQASEPLNLLIAEDNELNQLIINAMLAPLGHRMTFAGNGREAVDLVGRDTFDLILMDIRMPEMSGVQATREIRSMDSDAAKLPIIALTADAMTENRTEYAAAGMDECVTKPIDRRELMLAINDVLGKSIHSASDEPVPEPNADAMASVPEEQELTDDVLSFLADIDGLTAEPPD